MLSDCFNLIRLTGNNSIHLWFDQSMTTMKILFNLLQRITNQIRNKSVFLNPIQIKKTKILMAFFTKSK